MTPAHSAMTYQAIPIDAEELERLRADIADITLKHQVACDTIARMKKDEELVAAEFAARVLIDNVRVKAIERLRASHAELVGALKDAKISHYTCEDCWYSCPKSPDGCCNENAGDECNCGADQHNAAIDAALAKAEEK